MNSKASALKSKIVDKTSDVLSFPRRALARNRISRDTRDFNVLKQANNSQGAHNFDASGRPTDAFKVQTMAESIKRRYRK